MKYVEYKPEIIMYGGQVFISDIMHGVAGDKF